MDPINFNDVKNSMKCTIKTQVNCKSNNIKKNIFLNCIRNVFNTKIATLIHC